MNLCLNAFVIQFPNGLLDTCSVTAPRALLLPYAHRGHCKDEDSYKEYWSHVEFSISLTRKRRHFLSISRREFEGKREQSSENREIYRHVLEKTPMLTS